MKEIDPSTFTVSPLKINKGAEELHSLYVKAVKKWLNEYPSAVQEQITEFLKVFDSYKKPVKNLDKLLKVLGEREPFIEDPPKPKLSIYRIFQYCTPFYGFRWGGYPSSEEFLKRSKPLKAIWSELIKKGVDANKLHKIITRYPFPLPFITAIINAEKEWEIVDKITLKSIRHYRTLKQQIEKDKGFSLQAKKPILQETKENIRILEAYRELYSKRAIIKIRKPLGLDKKSTIYLQKNKAWGILISKLADYINKFYHTDSCNSKCIITHEKTFKTIAILIKTYYPTIWKEPASIIASRIKAKFYKTL